MSESTTALYERGRARSRLHPGCCSTLPTQAQRTSAQRNNNSKPSNNDISYVTHTVMKSKSQRKNKIRKLLFLLCILVGILVALTGIVVGFAVLAPFNGSGGLVPLKASCISPPHSWWLISFVAYFPSTPSPCHCIVL